VKGGPAATGGQAGRALVSADQASLDEDLEAWTLKDQANPAFWLARAVTYRLR